MENTYFSGTIIEYKNLLTEQLKERHAAGILDEENVKVLTKLINNAETKTEADQIMTLGTMYRSTGFHFDARLEKKTNTIKYLKYNSELSFDQGGIHHKLIVGDNYPALQNLLIQYRGQIDLIYIDPPYGKDDMGDYAKTNYDNALDRNALLSMLYPRLLVAKQLLSSEGAIFCSIDDRNQAYVKGLFDTVFDEKNFLGTFIQDKGNSKNDSTDIQRNHEYILCYRKQINKLSNGKVKSTLTDTTTKNSKQVIEENGRYYYLGDAITTRGEGGELSHRLNLGYTIYYNPKTGEKKGIHDYDQDVALVSDDEDKVYSTRTDLVDKGFVVIRPPRVREHLGCWTWELDKFESDIDNIIIKKTSKGTYLVKKRTFVSKEEVYEVDGKLFYDVPVANNVRSMLKFSTNDGTTLLNSILGHSSEFDNPKNMDMMKYFVSLKDKEDAIILDFFAGSGTTGQAVLEINRQSNSSRQFILCTNNEKTKKNPNGVVVDVTSKRLKRTMSGRCYDGSTNFKWLENNEPYGDSLDVYDIAEVSDNCSVKGKTPFDVIDETAYGLETFMNPNEKIKWICENFDNARKELEE